MDAFVLSCLNLYGTNRNTISSPYRESLHELLLIAHRDMERNRPSHELPWYKHVLHTMKNQIERLRELQVHAKITATSHPRSSPDDSIPMAILKNVILFFLIIFPPVKNHVDVIIRERASRINQLDQPQEEQAEPNSSKNYQRTHQVSKDTETSTTISKYITKIIAFT